MNRTKHLCLLLVQRENHQPADQCALPWLPEQRQLWSGWCRCLLGPWCHLLVHTGFHTDHQRSSEDTGPWSPQVTGHGTQYHKLYPAINKGRWHVYWLWSCLRGNLCTTLPTCASQQKLSSFQATYLIIFLSLKQLQEELSYTSSIN